MCVPIYSPLLAFEAFDGFRLELNGQKVGLQTEHWFFSGLDEGKILIYWYFVGEYLGEIKRYCGDGLEVGNL